MSSLLKSVVKKNSCKKQPIIKHLLLLAFFAFIQLSTISYAERVDIPLADNHPSSYIVVKGDTLWDISGKFLKNPWQWPEIWQINQQIKNPHLIYPGDEIYLTYVDGQPVLKLKSNGERPTFKMSPHKRIEKLDLAISTIHLEKVAPYLNENRIVEENTLENAPYIVGTSEEHLIAATDYRIYVNNISSSEKSARYGIYRKGETLMNPNKQDDILAYEAIYLGEANLIKIGNPSSFIISKARAEVLNGARLLPLNDNNFNSNFMPKAAQTKKRGSVLTQMTSGVRSNAKNTGANDVIIINFGDKDGVVAGDVFNIYHLGRTVNDPIHTLDKVKLPDTFSGNALVFRVFKRVSYALVMDASQEINIGDIVVSPYIK